MSNNSTSEDLQSNSDIQLRQKSKKLAGFYVHLFWFVVVNILLYILDFSTNGKIDWAYWTTFGWGIGVASHAFSVFVKFDLEEKIYQNLKSK